MFSQPHLVDELSRIKTNHFFLSKKISSQNLIFFEENLKNLLKATRYLDLIFFTRLQPSSNENEVDNKKKKYSNFIFKENQNFSLSFGFSYPISLEGLSLSLFSINQKVLFGKIFFDFLKNKKGLSSYLHHLNGFFKNEKNGEGIKVFKLIHQFDLFFFQKNFAAAKNCLSRLTRISEKEAVTPEFSGDIAFRAGKMALNQKKVLSAFSNFLEAYEKTGKRERIKMEKIIEWLLFCVIFLKKSQNLPLKKKDPILEKKKNYILAKFLGNTLQRKDLSSINVGSFEKWNGDNFPIKKILTKINFNLLKQNLREILKISLHVSLEQLASMLGASKKTLEFLGSALIVQGGLQGIFDYKKKSFDYFEKTRNRLFIKTFLSISVRLNAVITQKIKNFL